MSALATILGRVPDPEADVVPGKEDLSGGVDRHARIEVASEVPKREPSLRDSTAIGSGERSSPPAQNITSLPQALDASVAFLLKFMRFDGDHQAHVCALWSAYCYVYEAFDFAPYLFIRSPERECGKSKLVKCIRCLVPQKPRQVHTASISISSLARTIHKHRAIVFLDEIDKFFAHGTDEPIVGILNAGFEKGATYDRYNVQLRDNEEFDVYSPKCFSGIGNKLDDTTTTRSLTIRLNKQSRDNPSAILRESRASREVANIRDFYEIWAKHAGKELPRIAESVGFPKEMQDGRKRDICEPLLAVADMAGGEWPDIARAALVAITTEVENSSEATQLLKDIRAVYETKNTDKLTSHELLDELVKLEGEGPWAVYWERDLQAQRYNGPARKLSTMLGEFKIGSHNIRCDDGEQHKGFRKADFVRVWAVYCPQEIERKQTELSL